MDISPCLTHELALALFHQGKWAQALSAFQHEKTDCLSPENAAAWGICQLFATYPLDIEAKPLWKPDMQPILELLRQGKATGWPEVSACQAWLELLQEYQSAPAKIPTVLGDLVEACRSSHWFPIWTLALRALAYFDRRLQLRDLLATTKIELIENDGYKLVLAEARLECAQRMPLADLRQVAIPTCLPLTPQVTELWRRWLRAEFMGWENDRLDEHSQAKSDLSACLETPPSQDDSFSASEWRRLSYHAMLWQAKWALSKALSNDARQWLDKAARTRPAGWEWRYLSGLLAWSRQDHVAAQSLIEESLAVNPFQSRVRFELGMLIAGLDPAGSQTYLESMPGVHDAAASLAVVYHRLGKTVAAQQCLAQLSQAENPYSLSLILPQARALRLHQGLELCAHLAELEGDWLKAVEHWDTARQRDVSARQSGEHPINRSGALVHRAHRLYLLGLYLHGMDSSDHGLQEQFHKELARLSLRPLLGDAMFYRGLAAEECLPERALADWRGLLRQTAWLEQNQRMMPNRLLYLGDQMHRAGHLGESGQAYAHADMGCASSERATASALLAQETPVAEKTLQILDAMAASQNPLWIWLRCMCLLTLQPPAHESARTVLGQAQQAGLPASLQQLGAQLLSLASMEANALEGLADWLDGHITALPPSLELGLASLCRSQDVTTLQRCEAQWGAAWMRWCPVLPTAILGIKLRECCSESRYTAALEQIEAAATMGVGIPAEWRAYLCLMQATQAGLKGDFAGALESVQIAMGVLPMPTIFDSADAGRQ